MLKSIDLGKETLNFEQLESSLYGFKIMVNICFFPHISFNSFLYFKICILFGGLKHLYIHNIILFGILIILVIYIVSSYI